MNVDLANGDAPLPVSALQAIPVTGTYKGRLGVPRKEASAVYVADRCRMVRINEGNNVVGRDVLGLIPGWPQHIMKCLANAVVTTERAEGRADIPDTVFPPNRKKAFEVSLIEAVTIVRGEIAYCVTALQFVQTADNIL